MRVALFSGLAKNTGCWLKLGYLARALEKHGVEVQVFDPLPPMPLFLDFVLSIPWNIVRVLACRCDVLIGAKPFLHITFPFLLRRWFRGTWTVVDVDDLDWEYRSGFLRTVVRMMQTACTRFMDMVTYHNTALLEPLEQAFKIAPSKLYGLKQGVDFDVFNRDRWQDSEAVGQLRARYGIQDRDEVLVYSAHLNAASCLDGVLEIVGLALQQHKGIKLVVIGGGTREKEYLRLAEQLHLSGSVIFTGYLKPEDVAAHVMLGDIALVYYDESPANRYRCSMKLRELLAMGRIVICNRTGEAEAFSDYLVVAESDVGAMSMAILEAIQHKSRLKAMAEKGRQFIHDALNWESIGAGFALELKKRMGALQTPDKSMADPKDAE